MSADPVLPSSDRVDVWIWSLDNPELSAPAATEILSGEETARADRFRNPQHRTRYIAAHSQLRKILAGCTGLAARELTFNLANNGKPSLANAPAPPYFNLSHGNATAALAVTKAAEVGIDIEYARTIKEDVATIFSATEQVAIAALPKPEQPAALLRCWTRKEAVVKALGDGLSYDLKSFDVTVGEQDAPRLLRLSQAPADKATWTLHHLQPMPDLIGAVAVRAPSINLQIHNSGEPLKRAP